MTTLREEQYPPPLLVLLFWCLHLKIHDEALDLWSLFNIQVKETERSLPTVFGLLKCKFKLCIVIAGKKKKKLKVNQMT